MKKFNIVFLSHYDDEFGIIYYLNNHKYLSNTKFFYLTSGYYKVNKKNKRIEESQNYLKKFGVKNSDIYHIGHKYNIKVGTLYLKLKFITRKIKEIFDDEKIIPTRFFALIFEGGHEDHDSTFAINFKISELYKKKAYYFPLYNKIKNSPWIFFKTLIPYDKNIYERITTNKIKISDKIDMLLLIFYFRSQWKTFLGLYPLIIYHLIFDGKNYLIQSNKIDFFKLISHKDCLYERRGYNYFKIITKNILKFINSQNY